MSRTYLILAFLLCLPFFCFSGCSSQSPAPDEKNNNTADKSSNDDGMPKSNDRTTDWQPILEDSSKHADAPFIFTELSPDETGVNFSYYGGPSSERYMTEQNGGGLALCDFDRDGSLDLFCVNGSYFDRPASEVGERSRLYRNTGEIQFIDITDQSAMDLHCFGMGTAAADYDNDGFIDLFIACYGKNHLWRNNGDGTFSDVTDEAGVGDKQWGTSAAWADIDADGDLDLYVVNYVEWSSDEPPCFSQHDPPVRISCTPTTRDGQSDLLYENLGDGHFHDRGESSGIALGAESKGLAVGIADLNGDSLPDIYVANDMTPYNLFINRGDWHFTEEGNLRGVAYSHDGQVGAGMGVGVADYNRDGRFDLAVTNFLHKANDVYENVGGGEFRPVNTLLGIDALTRPKLAFGVAWSDFDLDDWPDLFFANGHIWDYSAIQGQNYEYRMTPQLLHNVQGKRFADSSSTTGDYFTKPHLGRATAAGDLDNDRDTDLVIAHGDEPYAILRNDHMEKNGLSLQVIGIQAARQPLSIAVEVKRLDGTTLVGWIPSGGSFQATHDDRLLFAWNTEQAIDEIRVHWPGKNVEVWKNIAVANPMILIEGTGQSASTP